MPESASAQVTMPVRPTRGAKAQGESHASLTHGRKQQILLATQWISTTSSQASPSYECRRKPACGQMNSQQMIISKRSTVTTR